MNFLADLFGRQAPDKIICVGLNYRDHAAEQGADLPAEPLLSASAFATLTFDHELPGRRCENR